MTTCPWRLVWLASAATACVGPDIDYGEVRTVEVTEANPGGYRLTAGDEIQVVYTYNPEHNIKLTVRPDGRISMPFAEEVVAAGRTIPELDADLTERVRQHLQSSDLSVVVTAYARQKVYIGGEVARPGEVPLIPGMTVFQAIAHNGWFRETAAWDSVVLVRHSEPGVRKAMKIDFSEEALIAHDVELQPFDIVYVPKTSIARVNVWVDQYINQVIPRIVNIQYNIVGRTVIE